MVNIHPVHGDYDFSIFSGRSFYIYRFREDFLVVRGRKNDRLPGRIDTHAESPATNYYISLIASEISS